MSEPRIDYGRMLDVLGFEVEQFGYFAEHTAPESPVPSCPGLTVGETVRHVGSIFAMVSSWLSQGTKPQTWQRKPRPRQSMADFVRASFASLHTVLAEHTADDPCQTWHPAQSNYGFWARRMLHETVIHRVDLSAAAGVPPRAVDPDVAVDGIDEVLSVWFEHRLHQLGLTGHRRNSVLLHSLAPAPMSWLASVDRQEVKAHAVRPPGDVVTDLGALGADATVRAEPMNLYLWLWGRIPARQDLVEVQGDDDAVAQLWALLRLATR